MSENDISIKQESGAQPTNITGRMDKIMEQVQALKLSALGQYLEMSRDPIIGSGPDAIRFYQLALKSIEVELKIITQQMRSPNENALPIHIDVIWDAMNELPEYRALLRNSLSRRRLLEVVKSKAEKMNLTQGNEH